MSEIALRRVREVLGTCEKKFGIEEKAETFMRTDVLSGNEEVGTVEHIRLSHGIGYGLTSLFVSRETNYATALTHMETVRYLMRGKFDAVFYEGKTVTGYANDKAREDIRAGFEDGDVSKPPTLAQVELLVKYGAAYVYSVLTDTPVHAAESSELNKRAIDGVIEGGQKYLNSEEGRVATGYARERYAAKQVRSYLNEHPGAHVALLYGSEHSFRFDFLRDMPLSGFFPAQFGSRKKEERPVVREVLFPAHDLTVSVAEHGLPSSELERIIINIRIAFTRNRNERRRLNKMREKEHPLTQQAVSEIVT